MGGDTSAAELTALHYYQAGNVQEGMEILSEVVVAICGQSHDLIHRTLDAGRLFAKCTMVLHDLQTISMS